jgi:CubicO group peptidase (beta-lactamase class C family)
VRTNPDKIDQFMRDNLDAVFPAAALVVYHRGKLVIDAAWGWIDPETRQMPVTPETRFDFASLTKLFTTTAFLTLVSEGATSLTTPLITVVPEFGAESPRPIDGGQDPHSKAYLPTPPERAGQTVDPARVTCFHLLTHTSGLPPWRDVYRAAGEAPPPPAEPDPIPRAERWSRALAAMCRYAFVSQPGEEVRYSDIGLMLLGEALSRLHGTPGALEQAIRDRVLGPLGLPDVGFNLVTAGVPLASIPPTEFDPTWRKRRVWGEVHDENACGVGGVAGHAGLFGTARAVARLGQAWAAGAVPGVSPQLVAAAVSEQAVTGNERRGLGWMLRSHQGSSAGDRFGPRAYGHTGFVGNSLWVDPDQGLVVACLTNSVYRGRGKGGILEFRRALHDLLWETFCA